MVTVVMEPNCLNPKKWPSGTVKGKLATKLYVNLSSDSDDDKLSEGPELDQGGGKGPARGGIAKKIS